jgi:hypothetical protein
VTLQLGPAVQRCVHAFEQTRSRRTQVVSDLRSSTGEEEEAAEPAENRAGHEGGAGWQVRYELFYVGECAGRLGHDALIDSKSIARTGASAASAGRRTETWEISALFAQALAIALTRRIKRGRDREDASTAGLFWN